MFVSGPGLVSMSSLRVISVVLFPYIIFYELGFGSL